MEGRRRIQTIKPDAVLINEGRKAEYLLQGFDANYGFDWHQAIFQVVSGTEPASFIRATHEKYFAEYHLRAHILRDMDNHDTVTDWPERVEVLAGHDGMELIQVLNFAIDGVPMVYCGNELADTARVNMFANRFHMGNYEVTDRSIAKEEYSLRRQSIVTALNAWRKESETLRSGTTVWLDHDQADKVLAFRREQGKEWVVFVGNLSKEACIVTLDKSIAGGTVRMSHGAKRLSEDKISLEAYGYLVLEEK